MVNPENFPETMKLLEEYAINIERDLKANVPWLTGQLSKTLVIRFFANEVEYVAEVMPYAQWLRHRRKPKPKNPKPTPMSPIWVESSKAFDQFKVGKDAENPVPVREMLNLIDDKPFTRKYRSVGQRIKVLKDKLAIALKKDVEALVLQGFELPSRFSIY